MGGAECQKSNKFAADAALKVRQFFGNLHSKMPCFAPQVFACGRYFLSEKLLGHTQYKPKKIVT
jgi:hypothetical protein